MRFHSNLSDGDLQANKTAFKYRGKALEKIDPPVRLAELKRARAGSLSYLRNYRLKRPAGFGLALYYPIQPHVYVFAAHLAGTDSGEKYMPKPLELAAREAGHEDRVTIGLTTASLLRRVRAQGNPLVSYYFEMAWTAYYQSMDEITRMRIAEGLEDAR
jgi:hypothetical protein